MNPGEDEIFKGILKRKPKPKNTHCLLHNVKLLKDKEE